MSLAAIPGLVRLGLPIQTRDYGVQADGVTDDLPARQKIFDTIREIPHIAKIGAVIQEPIGESIQSGPLVIHANRDTSLGIVWQGAHSGNHWAGICGAEPGTQLVDIYTPQGGIHRLTVDNLRFRRGYIHARGMRYTTWNHCGFFQCNPHFMILHECRENVFFDLRLIHAAGNLIVRNAGHTRLVEPQWGEDAGTVWVRSAVLSISGGSMFDCQNRLLNSGEGAIAFGPAYFTVEGTGALFVRGCDIRLDHGHALANVGTNGTAMFNHCIITTRQPAQHLFRIGRNTQVMVGNYLDTKGRTLDVYKSMANDWNAVVTDFPGFSTDE